jgi:hypothetical protein
MVMTTRPLDLLYHLGFSATWYVTSLLPHTFVLARLGAILVGWPALLCAIAFLLELLLVSVVESYYHISDKSSRRDKARHYALIIVPSVVLLFVATSAVARGEFISSFVVGLFLGLAMSLTTIPAQDLGDLNNQLTRFAWAIFFAYLAALLVTYYVTYYSLPRDAHILPPVTLQQDHPPARLSGALITDTNGYWYVLTGKPARVMVLRDDTIAHATIMPPGP